MANDIITNRKSKDSIFVKLFQDKNNVLKLYKEIHPENDDISVDDINIYTLDSVIVNTIYNDLGFLVKDKFILLVEAQSTWNPNIPVRMLFYLSETLRRYIADTKQIEHSRSKVKLPKPELYVIYSGEEKIPDVVSLNDEFFDGTAEIDLKVKIFDKIDETISGQYIGFCKVFDEQRKIYSKGVQAARETFRICIEKSYLTDFMKSHEREVIDMMSELFDEEVIRKQYDIARFDEGWQGGRRKGRQEERQKTIEAMRKLGISEEQIKAIYGNRC